MKKSLCLFLCLVLLCALFAGCGKEPPAATEPPVTDADASAAEDPTEPAEPLSFSLGSLPQIGAFAETEKKESFFPDGPKDVFEPREDYKEVVPYSAGSDRYFAAPWSFTDQETGEVHSGMTSKYEEDYYGTYGFATADGKLITNGIYADVFWADNGRGAGFYAAFREQAYEIHGKAELIAPDGSWFLQFDDEVEVDPMVYGHLSEPAVFMVGSEQAAALYNYQGEKVLDVTQYRDEYATMASVPYIDGEKLLVEHNDWENDVHTFVLYDYSGNRLGELPQGIESVDEVFPGGIMIVTVGEEQVQLMDLSGSALGETYEKIQYSAKEDCFLAKGNYDDSPIIFLDKQGKEIKTLDLFYYTVKGSDGNLWIFDESENTFYDFDGNPTLMDADGQEIVAVHDDLTDWRSRGSGYYYYAETANGALYLFDTSGNKVAKLEEVTYATYENSWGDVEKDYQIYLQNGILICEKKDAIELQEISSGKTVSIPIKSGASYRWTELLNDRLAAIEYQLNEDEYIYTHDIYDMETGELLFANAIFADHFSSFALVATKTESILLDNTATPLIRLRNDVLV